jgi:hypothetical protein
MSPYGPDWAAPRAATNVPGSQFNIFALDNGDVAAWERMKSVGGLYPDSVQPWTRDQRVFVSADFSRYPFQLLPTHTPGTGSMPDDPVQLPTCADLDANSLGVAQTPAGEATGEAPTCPLLAEILELFGSEYDAVTYPGNQRASFQPDVVNPFFPSVAVLMYQWFDLPVENLWKQACGRKYGADQELKTCPHCAQLLISVGGF